MDKQELERRFEAAEKQILGLLDEIKNLKSQLAEMQDEPEIPEKPEFEMNEKFYYLDSATDDVEDSYNYNDIDAIDFNMFHTEEYAKEFSQKCKLIAMMLHCKWHIDRDYVPDWKNPEEWKYFALYNNSKNAFEASVTTVSDIEAIMFGTEEAAEKCADWLNKHWRNTDEESV